MEPAKILVVEDEVIVARTIASQLNQLGYTVVGTASYGKDAIAKASATPPELVLMDIILKGEMNGIDAASYIREHLHIPVVFLTAYGDEDTLERAKITQPFGYIVKPFTTKDLRLAIEIALLQHRLERELRQHRDQLATILNSMSDAVIATDQRGIVTFMNPACEALTGWSKDEALGSDIVKILPLVNEVTGAAIENPVTKVIREQQVVYLDEFTSLISRNGTRIPIGDSASPLRERPNKMSGVVVVFWDNSTKRKTELLTKALEKEQELNNLKSLFISTVSHEFRNPLSVIQTAVELIDMQGGNLPESKRKTYVKRIQNSVQSMKYLMEDVLFMGRAEAGKLECNPSPINLEQFCRDLIEELSATGNWIEIVFTCHGDCTNPTLDERLLHYMLVNLLSNAVKYSSKGKTIQFELTCNSLEGVVIFQIQDQGIGIPESDQARLFESFYRASNVKSIQGNGLGLAIVKRCVDAHCGEIRMTSQLGIGTTVTITLPLNVTVMG